MADENNSETPPRLVSGKQTSDSPTFYFLDKRTQSVSGRNIQNSRLIIGMGGDRGLDHLWTLLFRAMLHIAVVA